MAKYTYNVCGMTDPGNVRAENQDSFLIKRGQFGGDDFLLLAIADGMGGLEKGELASGEMMRILDNWWKENLKSLWSFDFQWRKASEELSYVIEEGSRKIQFLSEGQGIKAGTTLSLVFLYRNCYLMKHVGDSRIYRIQRHHIYQVSKDHTWCQREVDRGMMRPEEAENHSMNHVLVNAIGVDQNIFIDTSIQKISHDSGLLLCSDGFYHYLTKEEIMLLSGRGNPKKKLEKAFSLIKSRKADDNLTAILVQRKKWIDSLKGTSGWKL